MTSTPGDDSLASVRLIGVVGRGPLSRGIVDELRREGRAFEEFTTPPSPEGLGALSCLVLADDDDAGNVDAALHAHEARPGLPLVVRVFDPVLEGYLEKTSPGICVLSMSAVAMPALIDLAGDAPVSTVGVASWARGFTAKLDRLLVGALAAVLLLMAAGTLFFSIAMKLSVPDAFYFVVTTITTTGYGDITPKDHPDSVKLAATALMIAGGLTFAIVFALVSEWVFARRLDVVMGRVPTRWSNHVVLVGAGNMSVRLAEQLKGKDQHALVIERDPESAFVPVLRAQGHQVLVADATKERTLRLAGADRARAILVMTSRDAQNLHIALIAKSVSASASVWARIDSPPLANHVNTNSSIRAGSPLLMAAKAFAAEAMSRSTR